MGTEVHYKNLFPGYYSMRNVNEDSNNSNWHLFYGDNTFTNTHYYNNFNPRTVTDAYLGHEKDEIKQKMVQHEAIFKNQVHELHRLYIRQRDIMEEVKRKEFYKYQVPIDTSSSSSFMPSQKPYDDAQKWQIPTFPIGNSSSRPSIFGVEISNSPVSCSKGSKDCEIIECRPSKVRKKLFDLQLPAHKYIEPEDGEQVMDNQACEISSYPRKETSFLPKIGVKTFLDDLNEPVHIQESTPLPSKQAAFNHFHNKEVQHRGNYSEISSQFQDYSRFNQNPSIFGTSSAYPFISSSNDSLTHKLTSFQAHPSFLSSSRSHEVFGEKWHRNGCYGNRFYHGSSSGSKEVSARLPSSVGFDYRKCNDLDDGSKKIFKASNFVDLTDTHKGMDLNTVQTLSDDEEDDSRKCDKTVLPWLKSKPGVCKKDLQKEKDDSLASNKKLLGFPIFGNLNEASSGVSSMEHRGIDINVAWEDKDIDGEEQEETDLEMKNFKNHFDLNSCVTEDDNFLVTESVKSSKKITMEIDLEAPAVSEIEEEDNLESQELEKLAAQVIVVISSQQDHVGSEIDDNPLLWLVDVIDSCEKNVGLTLTSRETDEYEKLTLQIEETKEQDYMPTPLILDFQEPDEVGPASTSRPRRGQARRGRPRRDFQRDILPGMTSLSRHEITEDLQIFGGLMKATGHSWNFGLMRKNGKRVGARGRKKGKVVEITPVVAPPPPLPPLEERSFTGWGKTTRRPRRQRCGVGNSVAVQST